MERDIARSRIKLKLELGVVGIYIDTCSALKTVEYAMVKIIVSVLLVMIATPAVAECPSFDIDTVYSVDARVNFEFKGPE